MLRYEEIPQRFNLASYFLDRNIEEGRGGRIALYCEEREVSYAEVEALTNRIGHVLRELGVEPEDRVLLALSDSVEFIAAWYAVLKIGAVVAEAYTFLHAAEYRYYLNYSRAKVVVVDEVTLDKVRSIREECPYLRYLLVLNSVSDLLPGEKSLEAAIAEAPDTLEAAETSRDDIALWKFTTGSTGKPKAAVHLQHDPLISFEAYARDILGLTSEDIVLPVPKMFFGYARDLATLFTFGVGGRGILFRERSTPEALFNLVERYRPTILVNVPTMINRMIHHPDAGQADLSSLRLCVSAGEALAPEIGKAWEDRFGVEVVDGIGSSELYHIYISNRPGAVRYGSVGQLVPGYRARIVDARGNDVPDGETGELWVAGESAALMYWNDHARSKNTFAGDWVFTGDLFKRDEQGYFWFQGRNDDRIKVGGIWVAVQEVESFLWEHPAVKECAVVAHEQDGLQVPLAFIVLQPGTAASAAVALELQRFVRERLSPHKYPRRIEFVEELPRTASGKVDRKALAAHAGAPH